MATQIGDVIEDKYRIVDLIGEGGMSKVYMAIDTHLNKPWAIKEIKKSSNTTMNEVVVNSLLAEANLLKGLDHPALPRIVDIIDKGQTMYFIMDYIEGRSLDKVLEEMGPQSEEAVVDWAKQLADALRYLHNQKPPIIYRDMKPANVMLKSDGTVKIIDFGIAREYKENGLSDTTVLGTKGYAPPEQYGSRQTDGRSDIYSLGIGSFSDDVKKYSVKDDIYICKLKLQQAAFISTDFIVKGKISAEGELKLTVSVEGSKGIEYKNGNLRYIKSSGKDADFMADGKFEVTISPGLSFMILNKIALLEITLDVGAGVNWKVTYHLVDAEEHELYSGAATLSSEDAEEVSSWKKNTTAEEILQFAKSQGGDWNNYKSFVGQDFSLEPRLCAEWSLYPIVRLSLGEKNLVGDLAKKFGGQISCDFVKNVILLKGHIDIPATLMQALKSDSIFSGMATILGINAPCTYNFKPWDSGEKKIDEIDNPDNYKGNGSISVANTIVLSTVLVNIDEGETETLQIISLPSGYSLKDIVVTSDDESVASFDLKNGIINGKKDGFATLTVKTKDEKYKQYCSVRVKTKKRVTFSPLNTQSKGASI